ncbi:MAG: lipopolysaccharide heptosyltransferase II [Acidobacteriota bacterium]
MSENQAYQLNTNTEMSDTGHQIQDSRLAPKIMIRLPNWVGDAVMAQPALRELRRIFTDSHITFVARNWVAGLFEGEGLCDSFIAVQERRGVAGLFKDAQQLKPEKFARAILLTNSFASALTARLAGIAEVTGYARDARRVLLHSVIPFEENHQTRHQVFYYLNIAAEVEKKMSGTSRVDLSQSAPRLHATPSSVEPIKSLLEKLSSQSNQQPDSAIRNLKILVVNPGATNSRAKRWLAERFAETADRLAEQTGLQTVIVGAAGDSEAAQQVENHMRTRALNLVGKTTIAELKTLLAMARLTISNDTGVAHVAAAVGTPTVVIFGPTEHFVTRPFNDCAVVVRRNVDCSPCMHRDCPIDHRCMTGVQVDEVYQAAVPLLNAGKGGNVFDV